MSLMLHRQKEDLGGLVYLLTIDASAVTGDPSHKLRITNTYGEDGQGATYQGVQYSPNPYRLQTAKRAAQSNTSGSTVLVGDLDYLLTRFIDKVGGDIQGARVIELKVFGKFLDGSPDANSLAYAKRIDHVVSYVTDTENRGEKSIKTVDPLSKDIDVPSVSFTAGVPNGTTSAINIFPAVDRDIKES